MILYLPHDIEAAYASWNRSLARMLIKSGRFEVHHAKFPAAPRNLTGRVSGNFNFMRIDDFTLALDTWDTNSPSSVLAESGWLADHPLDMVLKIQWQPDPVWTAFRVPVVPWTIFPTQEFPLSGFAYEAQKAHRWTGILTGANRYGRSAFEEAAVGQDDFLGPSDGEGRKMPHDAYLRALQDCRWGISLGGKRGTDKKNRREIEYASCGMPLALNYQPHYPFEYVEGRQYVFLREPSDLIRLREIDPRPYAKEAKKLWANYFCPTGMADTLINMVRRVRLGFDPIEKTT